MLTAALLAVLASLVASLWLWMKHRHSYWRVRKVPGPAPCVPFGNCMGACLGRKAVYDEFSDMYFQYKHERYVGLFYMHTPVLMLRDLDIIKEVFVKQFQDFNGRGMYSDPERDAISGHLFILSGQPWRNLRVKLSPTFTSGKIKYYFSRVQECALNMQGHVEDMVAEGSGAYREDARELMCRYGTDIIASLILGLDSNSMKNPDSELRVMGRKTLEPTFNQGTRFNLVFFGRDVMKKFRINLLNPTVDAFFHRVVTENVAYREKNNVERADLLNLLIQLKNKGFIAPDNTTTHEENPAPDANLQKLTLGQIIAQVFVFYIAGFETSATTASYTLYELAKNPDIQEKVRKEIDEVLERHNGEITYESVNSVPYLDKVVSETLRMYPPVPFITREVMRRRTLPNTDLVLEPGTCLVIPANALHRDPEYWQNPNTYDPERFNDENKSSIHPMSYLPFGDGPRICIGMRLGLVQVKAALMSLLSRFEMSRCAETPETITMEPFSLVPAPIGGRGLPITVSRRRRE